MCAVAPARESVVAGVANGISAIVSIISKGVGAIAIVVASALAFACGGSSSSGNVGDGPDGSGGSSGSSSGSGGSSGGSSGGGSGSSSGGDGGGGDSGYPAFAPEMAQIVNNGGPPLATPKIVTVTWQSDPNSAAIQDFDDKLVASSWWSVLKEYGVGAGTSAATEHVVITAAATSPWADNDIDTWAQNNIANTATSNWPAPDANTMYVVYIPAAVTVTDPSGDPCDGYHVELNSASNADGVSYALIMEQCYVEDQLLEMQDTTETGSHEIAEGTTDPYPNNAPAWYGFDADHLAWELWGGWQDEVADACEYFDDGYYLGAADEPNWLSRIWSNASAKAGHNPCLPAPGGAYNNTTPLGLQAISITAVDVNDNISPFSTKGWRIAPGATAKVQVGFYSDAPMATWTMTATETEYCKSTDNSCPNTALTVTPTTFTGKNGDTVSLTIKVNNAPSEGTAAVLQLSSVARDTTQCAPGAPCNHIMPVIIGTY